MIIRLNENNVLELTEKAFFIKDFRDMYNYYAGKLKNDDRAMAAFSVMYYMYYFDSRFLIEFEDEEERFKEVRKFVFKGDEIDTIKIYTAACETYKALMDEDQTSLYTVMKKNVYKLKDFASRMTLFKKAETPTEEGEVPDTVVETSDVYVTYKDFVAINSSLPSQEDDLRKFKEKLQKHFKSEIDVYGGGVIGAYE